MGILDVTRDDLSHTSIDPSILGVMFDKQKVGKPVENEKLLEYAYEQVLLLSTTEDLRNIMNRNPHSGGFSIVKAENVGMGMISVFLGATAYDRTIIIDAMANTQGYTPNGPEDAFVFQIHYLFTDSLIREGFDEKGRFNMSLFHENRKSKYSSAFFNFLKTQFLPNLTMEAGTQIFFPPRKELMAKSIPMIREANINRSQIAVAKELELSTVPMIQVMEF